MSTKFCKVVQVVEGSNAQPSAVADAIDDFLSKV
jgi:hypothetical protein